MNLHFVDINPAVVEALRKAFARHPEVSTRCDDILEVATHCVVSPANSYGFMDGGIDAAYLEFFGPRLQETVQTAIQRRPGGMLPVGAALAVPTGHLRIPYLIASPTMEIPEEVPPTNAGRALRAVLRLVDQEPKLAQEIYCPGLATLTGRVAPKDAAAAMVAAYEHWLDSKSARE